MPPKSRKQRAGVLNYLKRKNITRVEEGTGSGGATRVEEGTGSGMATRVEEGTGSGGATRVEEGRLSPLDNKHHKYIGMRGQPCPVLLIFRRILVSTKNIMCICVTNPD